MSATTRPSLRQQRALLAALRGQDPAGEDDPAAIEALLRRYECGGWLHRQRSAAGAALLPEPWREVAARAHRKTLIDSLAALGILGEVLTRFGAIGVPVIVLKGASYLGDLYADPGERRLTDVDLLVRPRDAARAGECLLAAGFVLMETMYSADVLETRRFDMARPGPAPCAVEVHWQLGSEGRARFDQDGIWARSRASSVQGAACRYLGAEDGLLYHVWHQADSYFGPTLKWALDLRAMLERRRPDLERLLEGARAAGVRVALHLALRQVESIFPGTVPAGLIDRTAPGALRRLVLGRWLLDEPLEFLADSADEPSRPLLRPFLLDSPADALSVSLGVLRRPWRRRRGPPPSRPWEAAADVASGTRPID